jgi:hypothetical protein
MRICAWVMDSRGRGNDKLVSTKAHNPQLPLNHDFAREPLGDLRR